MPSFDPDHDWDSDLETYLQAVFGNERFLEIAEALMRPPLATCLRINTLRTTSESVIKRLPAELSPVDAAAVAAAGGPRCAEGVPGVVLLPGSGPHLDIDWSLAEGREVVISRKAGEAVLRGAQVFIPGVLAAPSRLTAGQCVAVSIALEPSGALHADVTRGSTSDGGPTAASGHKRQQLHVGLGIAEVPRGTIFKAGARGVAVVMTHRVFATPSCNGLLPGEVHLQNLPSVIAAHVVEAKEGARVLDMCAAPGGKTVAIATAMENRGEVVALERSGSKMQGIRDICREFGVTCITAHRMDSTKAVLRVPAAPLTAPDQANVRLVSDTTATSAAAGPQLESNCAGYEAAKKLHSAIATTLSSPLGGNNSTGAEATGKLIATANNASACPTAVSPVSDSAAAIDALAVSTSSAAPGLAELGIQSGLSPEAEMHAAAKVRNRRQRKAAFLKARGQDVPVELLLGRHLEPARLCGFPPASFDHVLLDGPCSGLGLRPRLIHRMPLVDLFQAAAQQRRMIDVAVEVLRPGGTLVYSTCTINPGENEGNVRYALDQYSCLTLVKQTLHIGGAGIEGPCECAVDRLRFPSQPEADGIAGEVISSKQGSRHPPWSARAQGSQVIKLINGNNVASMSQSMSAGQLAGKGLSKAEAALCQRFDPAAGLDTPGFFIAKFQKTKAT